MTCTPSHLPPGHRPLTPRTERAYTCAEQSERTLGKDDSQGSSPTPANLLSLESGLVRAGVAGWWCAIDRHWEGEGWMRTC
jgi:hypothetical protein